MNKEDKVIFSIYLNLAIAKVQEVWRRVLNKPNYELFDPRNSTAKEFFAGMEKEINEAFLNAFNFNAAHNKPDTNLFFDLVKKIFELRNYCSHFYYKDDPFVFRADLKKWVEELFEKARGEIIARYPHDMLEHIKQMHVFNESNKLHTHVITEKVLIRQRQEHKLRTVHNGLKFFCSLFLTSDEATTMIGSLPGTKRSNDRVFLATRQLFTYYSVRPGISRFDTNDEKFRYFIQMLNELNFIPLDLFKHLNNDKRAEWKEAVRHKDRLGVYALRYLEDNDLLPAFVFRVDTGKTKPKKVSTFRFKGEKKEVEIGQKKITAYEKGAMHSYRYDTEHNNVYFKVTQNGESLTGYMSVAELQKITFALLHGIKQDAITKAVFDYVKNYRKFIDAAGNKQPLDGFNFKEKETRAYLLAAKNNFDDDFDNRLIKRTEHIIKRYTYFYNNRAAVYNDGALPGIGAKPAQRAVLKKYAKVMLLVKIIKHNMDVAEKTNERGKLKSRNYKLNYDRYEKLQVLIGSLDSFNTKNDEKALERETKRINKIKADLIGLMDDVKIVRFRNEFVQFVNDAKDYNDLFEKVAAYTLDYLKAQKEKISTMFLKQKIDYGLRIGIKQRKSDNATIKKTTENILKGDVALPQGFSKREIFKLDEKENIANLVLKHRAQNGEDKMKLGAFYNFEETDYDAKSFKRTEENGDASTEKNSKALQRFFTGQPRYFKVQDKVLLLIAEDYYKRQLQNAKGLELTLSENFDIEKILSQDVELKFENVPGLANTKIRMPFKSLNHQFSIVKRKRMQKILLKYKEELISNDMVNMADWDAKSKNDLKESRFFLLKILDLEEKVLSNLNDTEKEQLISGGKYYPFKPLIAELKRRNVITEPEMNLINDCRRSAAHYDTPEKVKFEDGIELVKKVCACL